MLLITILLLSVLHLAMCRLHTSQRRGPNTGQQMWRLPGLVRPVWIMDREFDTTPSSPARKDRLFLKLNPNNTVTVYNFRKRPWLEWFKKKPKAEPTLKTPESARVEEVFAADGTWTAIDEAVESGLNTYKVKIEINESLERGRTLHEARCTFGKLDGYAAFFRRGVLFKYKGSQKGADIKLGQYTAGKFDLRANVQRPLLSKDFLAIQ